MGRQGMGRQGKERNGKARCLLSLVQVQDALWWTLYQAEGVLKDSWLRQRALAECMKLIHYEVCSLQFPAVQSLFADILLRPSSDML